MLCFYSATNSLCYWWQSTPFDVRMMKLGIIGSRAFTNDKKVRFLLEKYVVQYDDLVVVSGGCPNGGDYLAKKVALEMGLNYKEFPPCHSKHNQYCVKTSENYGKPYHVTNFFVRNTEIAEYCDHIIGFVVVGVKANGTMDTIEKARKLEKVTFVFED